VPPSSPLPVAHRATHVHRVGACWWLAVGLVGVAIVLVVGSAWSVVSSSAALGAFVGSLSAAAITSPSREEAPPGSRLATAARTRRDLLRQNAIVLAGVLVASALLGWTLDVWWPLALVGLTFGLAEVTLSVHVARWERRHADRFLAEGLGLRRRAFVWLTAWGDQAPAADVPRPPRPALAATGFWPSRDPDDYR